MTAWYVSRAKAQPAMVHIVYQVHGQRDEFWCGPIVHRTQLERLEDAAPTCLFCLTLFWRYT